ncbi:peroxidase family protein [Rhizobium leguminosarum]|uniref:Peroxidase family protein n=2 Tax=Rhizobium leguminosarum TaxID=384 RepID=A0ACD5FFF4_RHILE|nr:peroxidase family protein [Rhizobium leguminosarum]
MMPKRSKRCDKFVSRLRIFVLQNFAPFWSLVERLPFLSRQVNALIINNACNAASFRPHPMSTLCDYTSWRSLTDKTFLARAIPPAQPNADLPSVKETARIFMPQDGQRECPKSTLLFPIFAQYLTDGFLRTDPHDRLKTTTNHDIDLSPLYGRTMAQTHALRIRSEQAGEKGRLKSQMIEGEEFPPDLYQPSDTGYAPDFVDAQGAHRLDLPLGIGDDWVDGEGFRRRLFAMGGDRANSTATVAMLNTLFLREHNRLAGELEQLSPEWGDDRVFETARNIVIAVFIKIVVEEYINHISSACFRLKADPAVAWAAKWNKPNWMTVEFSLLYRWHSLVPQKIVWDGKLIDSSDVLLDNSKLMKAGLARAFQWAGQTPAAKLGLHNTAIFLENDLTVESRALNQNRDRCLQGYNAYRKSMGMKAVDGFDCMTGNPAWQDELRALYGSPDNVDFYVGLFAEDSGINTPMPPLLGAMVALDAFSQALNNPLLSSQVYNERTFTAAGMATIEGTTCLWDVLARNIGSKTAPDLRAEHVRMTRSDWRRRFGSF